MDNLAKAWLFTYTAAADNLGFEVYLKDSQESSVEDKEEEPESA